MFACDLIYLGLCAYVCEREADRDKVYVCTINSSILAVVKHGAQYHLSDGRHLHDALFPFSDYLC